jgi:hypothetical protein
MEYDCKSIRQSGTGGFDIILLHAKTLKELGIILYFQTKEIDTDEIICQQETSPRFQQGQD